MLSLSTYLRFWSVVCFAVTLYLIFVQKEVSVSVCHLQPPNQYGVVQDRDAVPEGGDMSIMGVYKTIWNICKLKRMRPFMLHVKVADGDYS